MSQRERVEGIIQSMILDFCDTAYVKISCAETIKSKFVVTLPFITCE